MNIQSTNRNQNTNFGALKVRRSDFNKINISGNITVFSKINQILDDSPTHNGTLKFVKFLENQGTNMLLSNKEEIAVNKLIVEKKYSAALQTLKDLYENAKDITQETLTKLIEANTQRVAKNKENTKQIAELQQQMIKFQQQREQPDTDYLDKFTSLIPNMPID